MDTDYTFTDDLSAYAFYSEEKHQFDQFGSQAGVSNNHLPDWQNISTDKTRSVRIGLAYQPTSNKVKLSFDYTQSNAFGDSLLITDLQLLPTCNFLSPTPTLRQQHTEKPCCHNGVSSFEAS